LVHGRFGPWMYEPHEAREDTVIFPALHELCHEHTLNTR